MLSLEILLLLKSDSDELYNHNSLLDSVIKEEEEKINLQQIELKNMASLYELMDHFVSKARAQQENENNNNNNNDESQSLPNSINNYNDFERSDLSVYTNNYLKKKKSVQNYRSELLENQKQKYLSQLRQSEYSNNSINNNFQDNNQTEYNNNYNNNFNNTNYLSKSSFNSNFQNEDIQQNQLRANSNISSNQSISNGSVKSFNNNGNANYQVQGEVFL